MTQLIISTLHWMPILAHLSICTRSKSSRHTKGLVAPIDNGYRQHSYCILVPGFSAW